MKELLNKNLIEKKSIDETSNEIFNILNTKSDANDANNEQDEYLITDISPSLEYHKRNKTYFQNINYIDSSSVAIEPKTGKQFIWNEIYLNERDLIVEKNNILQKISRLRQFNHPFILKFYEAWISVNEHGEKIINFITERVTIPTVREYITHTKLSQRLNDKTVWKKMTGQLLSAITFLRDIGIANSEITNENIHQSNCTIKFGLGAIDLLSNANRSKSYLDFGKLILEMCAYHDQDIPSNLKPNDIGSMLDRVVFEEQKDFIVSSMKENHFSNLLANFHLKLRKFVISLKVLAGKKLVDYTNSTENFPDVLRSHIDHFDNDTVIVRCRKNCSEKIFKWENFLLAFTVLPKFLEDIRNGFYSVFTNEYCEIVSNSFDRYEENGSCLSTGDLIDLDSSFLENEELIKNLEVKEKIYVSHEDTPGKETEIKCCEIQNLLNLCVDGEKNLIDLRSPVMEKKPLMDFPVHMNSMGEMKFQNRHELFSGEINYYRPNDILFQMENPSDTQYLIFEKN